MSAADAWEIRPAEVLPSRPALHLVPTCRDEVAGRTRLRISRFGRLVVTTGAVLVATILAVTLLGIGAAGASIDHRVSVRAGQTLSEVATAELPRLPVAEGVAQIQLANDLSTSQVHAGQELAIPVVG